MAGSESAAPVRRSGTWILATTIVGSAMAFIDSTVVNIALPAIQADLGADALALQWIVEAYALTLAAFLLIGGALSDREGRRKIFVIGAALFGVSSLACALAPSAELLVAFRAVQGVAGAMLTPASLAILGASFEGVERGRAIGTWSGAGALTTVIGPLLGGFLVEHASWRWAFGINPPLAVAVVVMALRKVPESRDERATGKLDLLGAALAVLTLGSLTFGLVAAGATGFSDMRVIVALVASVIGGVAFVRVEAVRPNAMVPLHVFRSKVFAGTNVITLLLYGALAGMLFFVPMNLIQIQGYGATAAGATMLPLALSLGLLSRWAGAVGARIGPRLPLVIGPAIVACGFVFFARAGLGKPYLQSFLPPVLFMGLGMSIAVAPLTTAVMSALEPRHAGLASGVNNAVARTAGVLAVAAFGVIMLRVFESSLHAELAHVAAPAEAIEAVRAQTTKLGGIEIPPGPAAATLRAAVDAAFLRGFQVVSLVAAGVALAASAIAAVTLRR